MAADQSIAISASTALTDCSRLLMIAVPSCGECVGGRCRCWGRCAGPRSPRGRSGWRRRRRPCRARWRSTWHPRRLGASWRTGNRGSTTWRIPLRKTKHVSRNARKTKKIQEQQCINKDRRTDGILLDDVLCFRLGGRHFFCCWCMEEFAYEVH